MQDSTGSIPSLAKPFAAFGAAAGLFAVLALGAFRPAAREVSPWLALVVTAAAGALVGAKLRRWRRLHDPLLPREIVVFWISVSTALAGAVSGAAIALATWGPGGIPRFGMGGAAVGLVFAPSCLVVFDAARRAGRARHGSLVAGSDARTVLSTVLAGISFAGAVEVPALLAPVSSSTVSPLFQALAAVGACAAGAAGIVALQRRDRVARTALGEVAKDARWLEPVDPDAAVAGSGVDLGMGAEQWTRHDAGYRSSGRTEVLVRGSIEEANAAFDECERRRHRSLLVAVGGLSATIVAVIARIGELR